MNIQELLKEIKKLKAKNNVVLIAIDGRGGAGKTTLANKLKDDLKNCRIIQMDDFYMPSNKRTRGGDFNFDWKRLEKEVLIPLSSSRAAKYQKYNWNTDDFTFWWEVQPMGIVIIEGCYSIRKELVKYYDLTIWIEIEKDIAIKRGIQRDIDNEKPIDVDKKIEHWEKDFQPLEDIYISEHNPKSYADEIILA